MDLGQSCMIPCTSFTCDLMRKFIVDLSRLCKISCASKNLEYSTCLDFQLTYLLCVWIYKICKILCAKNLEFSTHDLEVFLLCHSYRIMFPCAFKEKILKLILTGLCKTPVLGFSAHELETYLLENGSHYMRANSFRVFKN